MTKSFARSGPRIARASQQRRFDSAGPGWRQRLGVVLPVLSLLGGGLLAPRLGHAKSGFFETIGISVVVGTVLGASTLPFYDQPGTHVANLAYGAAAGAVVGLGILVHGLIDRGSSEGETGDGRGDRVSPWRGSSQIASVFREDRNRLLRQPFASQTALLPLVSVNW